MTTTSGTDSIVERCGMGGWSRSAIAAAVLVCLLEAAKLAMFCVADLPPRWGDAEFYWRLGAQVAAGDVWMTRDPVAFRTPGYPWLLGALQAAFGDAAARIAVTLQYFTVGCTTLVTGWWTWRLSGRPWLAVVALSICAISAARAGYASVMLTETLFTLALAIAVYLMTLPRGFDDPRVVLAFSLCWFAAWLLRPAAAALAPAWIAAVACHVAARNESSRWKAAVAPLLITAGMGLLVLGPWVARNAWLFGRPKLTIFLGRELWGATFKAGAMAPPPLPDSAEGRRVAKLVEAPEELGNNWIVSHALTSSGLSDVEADDLMRQVAWQAIRAHPVRCAARGGWRAVDFWRAVYSRSQAFGEELVELGDPAADDSRSFCRRVRDGWLSQTWESRLLTTELASLAALVGVLGLWLNPRTWRAGFILAATAAGFALVTATVEHPNYRYRMVLEPMLLVGGTVGWQVLFDVLRRGTRSLRETGPP